MELLIENLGPIKNNTQTIDLNKKFYNFIGYNNSGKTYVSQLLWTIFNKANIVKFSQETKIKSLDVYADFEEKKQEIPITQDLINEILDKFSKFIENELVNTYNLDSKSKTDTPYLSKLSFIARLEELNEIKIENNHPIALETSKQILTYLTIRKREGQLFLEIEEESISILLYDQDQIAETISRITNRSRKSIINSRIIIVLITLLLFPVPESFFLPASRGFLSSFYQYIYDIERKKQGEFTQVFDKMLDDVIIDNDGNFILNWVQRKLPKRYYTEPINKAIESLYSLNTKRELTSNHGSILQKLTRLMGGKITIESVESIAPIQFSFKFDKSNSLPMYLASSSVNQLTLLYLYFKYWAHEKDNFLIIDEPEVNLHPENQMRLMEILIQFVTEHDNRVLITTHSPIVTDILNNYVYIDTLKKNDINVEEIIEEHKLKNLNPDVSISKEDLGVYFFTGDRIIEYSTGQYGVYFRNFREVINSLQKSGEVLTDYIYSLENEQD